VLHRADRRLADPVLAALRARGDLVVGDNQPYSGELEFGYTIELHAQRARLPHVMLEIRQDEIATDEGAARYAALATEALATALAAVMPLPRWPGPLTPGTPWRRPRGLA
jgi:predicted N-formylglutamate amidohydrolase